MIKRNKKLMKILCSAMILFTLLFGTTARASSTYLSSNQVTYSQEEIQTVSKGKILIYHSHGNEHNKDSDIFQMGADLAEKLERKGYQIEHVTYDFSKDYNNAYYYSGKMLDSKDLSQYCLVIDEHVDSGSSPTITTINDKEVAKIMWVQTKTNPNLHAENTIANGINKELSRFGNISKGVYSQYNKGINFYNLSKSPNMLLLEMGNESNTYLQIKHTNTFLASSIDLFVQSNK